MSDELQCYRCGASLEALTLPISRQDQCPSCTVYLHVCRMCSHFDPLVPRQCREDDAEEVFEKERSNFCDWFRPASDTFDEQQAGAAQQATSDLEALFGEPDVAATATDSSLEDADDLFK